MPIKLLPAKCATPVIEKGKSKSLGSLHIVSSICCELTVMHNIKSS